MDFAHTETDKAIEELEKRLQAEYRQAYKETKAKLEKYLSDFAQKDEAKRKLVDEGKLSQADYKKWRTNQMLTGQRWTKMVDTLARDMNRTNQIAADIISSQLSPTFALNANYAAYGIENGFRTDYGFTLYDQETVNRLVAENPDLLPAPSVDIPADICWNKQKITSNITQAVLQGKSIPEIAKTMETVVGMNKASATRNARTAMTGAQNAGRQATYDRAKAMGIKVKKEWMATLDGRTRHSHGMADGQQVELDGKFTVGRAKMRYPGDVQNGTPEEIYNCRCTMVTVEPPEILQGEQPRMTYQEWEKSKKNAENVLKSGGKGGIIKIQKPSENAKLEIIDDIECWVEEVSSYGFPDGSGGIKKTAPAVIYTTPDGTKFVYPQKINTQNQTLTPNQAIKTWCKVPENIRSKIQKTIHVVDYYNPSDSYWRKKYKNFTHSYATGGDGITLYRCDQHNLDYLLFTYCHEGGHYIDYTLPGTDKNNRYSQQKAWKEAMSNDLKTSGKKSWRKYGENSPLEDFADSIGYFITDNENFKKTFPERSKLLEKFLL